MGSDMNRLVASQIITCPKSQTLLTDDLIFSQDGALVGLILVDTDTKSLTKALVFDVKDLSQHGEGLINLSAHRILCKSRSFNIYINREYSP